MRDTDLVIGSILIQSSTEHQAVEVSHTVAKLIEGAKLQRAVRTLENTRCTMMPQMC